MRVQGSICRVLRGLLLKYIPNVDLPPQTVAEEGTRVA